MHFEPNLPRNLVQFARRLTARTCYGVVRACYGALAALASHCLSNLLFKLMRLTAAAFSVEAVVAAGALQVLEAPNKDHLSAYLATLTRAHCLNAPSVRLNRKKRAQAMVPLESFVKLFSPTEMRTAEDKAGLAWSHVAAFVHLLRSTSLPVQRFAAFVCEIIFSRGTVALPPFHHRPATVAKFSTPFA